MKYFAAKLDSDNEAARHQAVAEAVHAADGKIALQILHAGRYAYHHNAVGPSAIKSPISMFTPSALSSSGVEDTISDFVRCAELAAKAGYDGVEVMGSEGYLINQFIALEANKRTDEWGGEYANRIRLPIEIVRRTRAALGPEFIIIFRLSMLDLVQGGSTWEEIELLAHEIEKAGASIINTGIGWHQARVPTIATAVPRGAFTRVTKKLMNKLDIPLCTTNRINTPETAEDVLAGGFADMISMARPFLADPNFLLKAQQGRTDEINTCISCNQSCLDHVFVMKRASCLVNPFAGYESELRLKPATEEQKKSIKVAVVGAGCAGLASAVACSQRGFDTTLFEQSSVIGGQFNLAKRVPGKEEFFETVRYFEKQLQLQSTQAGGSLTTRMNTQATEDELQKGGFTHVILASGLVPRSLSSKALPGIDHPKVVGYTDVLSGAVNVGNKVAIIGAGGIGFDVAEFLSDAHGKLTDAALAPGMADDETINNFFNEWKIDSESKARGGLLSGDAAYPSSGREIFLLQRTKGKVGANLAKTTGWIKRTQLKNRGVQMLNSVKYTKIDDQGLHISVKGKDRVLDVDHVVVCAGQEPNRPLWGKLEKSSSYKTFLIGGAEQAAEVDAKRAFDQGTRLAATLENAKTGDVFNQPVPLVSDLYQKFLKFSQG